MSFSRPFRPLVVLALLSVFVAGVPTAAGAQTDEDVQREKRQLERARTVAEDALAELRAANAALDGALVELNEINGELASLIWKTTQLRERSTDYQDESAALRERAESLVRDAYISGSNDLIKASLEANSIQEVVTRQLLLDQATDADLVSMTRLQAVSREMDRLQETLDVDLDRVAELRALSELIVRRMDDAQERANDAYANAKRVAADQLAEFQEADRLRKLEEEKKKRGSGGGLPPGATPGWQCPVPSGKFINDWGFPRSGGRTHQGTDVFAPRGTGALAVSSGTVRIDTYSLGGKIVWLRGNDGNQYYYAHLDGYPSGLRTGDSVQKGQVIGYIGNTGNAITTSPHVHFQLHPGGGSPVNPYPTLTAYC